MSPYRSEVIREVENDLHASRARGMLKHPGRTWTEEKAERRMRRQRYAALALGAVWVAAILLAAYYGVTR